MCQNKAQMKWQNDFLPWRLPFIKKQAMGAKVKAVVMNSYDNYYKFDQCDCSSSRSCKLPNETRAEFDIRKYVDIWTTYDISLPYILLGFLLLITIYVVVESFVSKQISIQKFIIGPEIERNDTKIDNEG